MKIHNSYFICLSPLQRVVDGSEKLLINIPWPDCQRHLVLEIIMFKVSKETRGPFRKHYYVGEGEGGHPHFFNLPRGGGHPNFSKY